ncbi:MAG: hypothetical protein KatS3mg051_1430 [Anaerolineae bacterium]|nr:MAG: hypothetical protein KatS3mg051_1430 [Anaerolineae bacterium]
MTCRADDLGEYQALARLAGETARAYAAFLDYVRLGEGRSLRGLLAHYQALHGEKRPQTAHKAPTEKPPTLRLKTLADWSTRYRWQERLAAYQAERARREQAVWERRRAEVRQADWEVSAELRELVRAALAQLPQFIKTTRTYVKGRDGEPDREIVTVQHDLPALLKALELASRLQRLAAEVPPQPQTHRVTGALVTVTADDLVAARDMARQLERELLDDDEPDDGDGDAGDDKPGL